MLTAVTYVLYRMILFTDMCMYMYMYMINKTCKVLGLLLYMLAVLTAAYYYYKDYYG